MAKSWFTVQAFADDRIARIDVRGYIGEWGVSDRDFIAAVEAQGEVDTIEVTINSRGGEVDHALAIFNFLKNHPAKVRMNVGGVAMSAASIILMAGDTIDMPANAILMVHAPRSWGAETAAEHRALADVLDIFESALLETYQARTGKTLDELKAMLATDTFMTAKEAVANGFADNVIALKTEARATAAMAYATALDIPLDVLERAQAEALAGGEPRWPVGFTITNDAGETFWTAPDGLLQDEVDKVGNAACRMNSAQAAAFLSANGYTPTVGKVAAQALADKTPITIAESLSSRIAAAASEAGLGDYVSSFALDGVLNDMPAVQQALSDARELVDLCTLVGLAEQAAPLIKKRATLADARTTLQAHLAALDEASHTDSTRKQTQTQPSTPSPNTASASSIWEARRQQARV